MNEYLKAAIYVAVVSSDTRRDNYYIKSNKDRILFIIYHLFRTQSTSNQFD